MRKSPLVIAAVLLVIQIGRIAHFAETKMQAGVFGWLFSAALAAAVFSAAYWTRQSATKSDGKSTAIAKSAQDWAWLALIALVIVDGYFNLADVLTTIDVSQPLILVSGCIYGAMPTLASALLGALQGKVDRLPVPPNAKKMQLGAIVGSVVARISQAVAVRRIDPLEARCDVCGWNHNHYKSPRAAQNALAAHGRIHAPR